MFPSSLNTLGWVTLIVKLLAGICFAIATVSTMAEVQFSVIGALEHDPNPPAVALALGIMLMVGSFGAIGFTILGAILFMSWLYAATKHLYTINTQPPGLNPIWAFLGYIIPFLNLFYPHTLVNQLWHGSDPDRDPAAWMNETPHFPITLWWVLCIAGVLLDRYSQVTINEPLNMIDVLGVGIQTVVSFMSVWLIYTIADRLRAASEQLPPR